MSRGEATIYVDTFDLATWLVQHLQGGVVAETAHRDVLALLDHVVLALRGVDRRANVDDAESRLTLLRVRLRLANATGLLDDRRLLFVTERVDTIGRQLGGWRRHLDARGTLAEHHR